MAAGEILSFTFINLCYWC